MKKLCDGSLESNAHSNSSFQLGSRIVRCVADDAIEGDTMELHNHMESPEAIKFVFAEPLSCFFLSHVFFKCLALFIVCSLSLFNFYFFIQVCIIMMNELLFSTLNYVRFISNFLFF